MSRKKWIFLDAADTTHNKIKLKLTKFPSAFEWRYCWIFKLAVRRSAYICLWRL